MNEIFSVWKLFTRIWSLPITVAGYTFTFIQMTVYFGVVVVFTWFLISWFHDN